jgi:hypothetical protein
MDVIDIRDDLDLATLVIDAGFCRSLSARNAWRMAFERSVSSLANIIGGSPTPGATPRLESSSKRRAVLGGSVGVFKRRCEQSSGRTTSTNGASSALATAKCSNVGLIGTRKQRADGIEGEPAHVGELGCRQPSRC